MYKPLDITRMKKVVIEIHYQYGPQERWGFGLEEKDAWTLLTTFEEIRKKAYEKEEENRKSCEYKQYLALQKKFRNISEEEYRRLMNCDKKDEEKKKDIYPPGSYL